MNLFLRSNNPVLPNGDQSSPSEFEEIVCLTSALMGASSDLVKVVEQDVIKTESKVGSECFELQDLYHFTLQTQINSEPVWFNDTQNEKRFLDYPWGHCPPALRFYAAAPLVLEEGRPAGMLFVYDGAPREKIDSDLDRIVCLKRLARLAAYLLERNTLRRELEFMNLQLKKASNLIALGKMTASIAHEVNNPLSILQARATVLRHLAREEMLTNGVALEHSERMIEIIGRISKIVDGIRATIENGDSIVKCDVCITKIIEDALSFSTSRFRSERIEIEYDAPPPGMKIWCNSVQITQVLLNLLSNAFDALMEEQGLSRRFVRILVKDFGDSVGLFVSNPGKTIPVEVRNHMFTPFFTTKKSGKGMGLGLSISGEILQAHQGELKYNSDDNLNTFVMRLPKLGHCLAKIVD